MKIKLGNAKQKALKTFDQIVKSATARAIPTIKKEAIHQITTSTTNLDNILKIGTVVAIGVGLFCVTKNIDNGKILPTVNTAINIDTLNLYFGENVKI